MTPTEEMVRVAAEAYDRAVLPEEGVSDIGMRAALSAAPVGGPLRRIVLDTLNAVAPAVENLSVHQEQCDRDGVMVKVSRQALDEVLNAVNEVAMQSAITASPDAPVAQEPVAYQYRACIAGKWGDWTDLHQSVEGFRNGPWKFGLENGTCELRALYAGTPPAAPVAQEPVAWVEFTEAGLIRFWTSDPARAEAERTRRSLTKFTLSELIALVGRPRTPPATPAGVGADEIARANALRECATIARDHTPGKHEGTLAAHVVGATIERAILALLSRGSGSEQERSHEDQSKQSI